MEPPNPQPRLFSLNGPSLTASPSPRHSFVSPLSPRQSSLSVSHGLISSLSRSRTHLRLKVVVAVSCPCVCFISGRSRRNQSSSICSFRLWWSSSSCFIAVSEPVNQGGGSNTEVTWEDQQNINKFGRLNNRFHELEDEIKIAKD
ncbi:uncharacterized protein LOC107465746 isoform X2 [Arachis duranensis]|uniref:Uncharacterized protein LOC107465746 isoform X2 n=1 Tax=Arachis duranensis TaxID=130453 RepID=A0A6P5MWY5_ARADU|nr:uncharacterized protein LOC107465746 isoform X2 [Arachis duranensis]XP_025619288.1 uncharacterized protein LOC112710998 isoform X2 [Arachis hypogaea]